jgi:hypothetical protein
MKSVLKVLRVAGLALVVSLLSGCDDPQVYGSIGVSSGYGSYGGYNRGGYNSRVHTSISIGGRIR